MISQGSPLWQHLSTAQRALASDGELLVEDRLKHPNEKLSDHSYLVFPYAKLYEGFLKQFFRDLNIISDVDYASDHFRIGKTLSPTMMPRLGKRSAYRQLQIRYGTDLADELWTTWKQARNMVFHYFPKNYRALTYDHAQQLIERIIATMETAVAVMHGAKQIADRPVVRYGQARAYA